jgi:hypothetical protein
LACNPSAEAIELLAEYEGEHGYEVWQMLELNPAIFVLDYVRMREKMRPLREELLRNRMHPRHLAKAVKDWQLI